VSKRFEVAGHWLPVLDGISLYAAAGEFVSIIGPSGCGKSTLFNILAGLVRPTAGGVTIAGEDVTGRLGLVGYMPQKDLLMPWKTVLDNTAIGMELQGMSRKEARRQALGWFPRFGLEGFERQYPSTLSGGMRQRAALLRTVLAGRDILLLDEPFGALDAITRMDMQEWLLAIRSQLERTIVFVTHDVDEAIYLSDRVYVLSPRPARVDTVVDVSLPRPRVHDEIVTSPAFAALKHQLLASLRGQRREEQR
jgi:ABC-type nitrate/sulfonate/bicarbonate transport system ATPase subunit